MASEQLIDELRKRVVVLLVKYNLPPLGNDHCTNEITQLFAATLRKLRDGMPEHKSTLGLSKVTQSTVISRRQGYNQALDDCRQLLTDVIEGIEG